MWPWLESSPCLIPRGALECESHHRVCRLWGKGLAFCTTQGLVPDCLVCGRKLGPENSLVPRVLLWERASESPAANTQLRPTGQPRPEARVQWVSTASFQPSLFALSQGLQSQVPERPRMTPGSICMFFRKDSLLSEALGSTKNEPALRVLR